MSRPRNARVAALVGLRDIHMGVFFKGQDALLRWGDRPDAIHLQTIDKGRLANGVPVRWVISGEHVQLHVKPPQQPDAVNLVRCELIRLSRLGEFTTLVCQVATSPVALLHLDITTRQAAQLSLAVGQTAFLQLDPRGIHIMPVRQ